MQEHSEAPGSRLPLRFQGSGIKSQLPVCWAPPASRYHHCPSYFTQNPVASSAEEELNP